MSDICEPCQKDDHAWCYRRERMRWWVTCLCQKHDRTGGQEREGAGRDGSE